MVSTQTVPYTYLMNKNVFMSMWCWLVKKMLRPHAYCPRPPPDLSSSSADHAYLRNNPLPRGGAAHLALPSKLHDRHNSDKEADAGNAKKPKTTAASLAEADADADAKHLTQDAAKSVDAGILPRVLPSGGRTRAAKAGAQWSAVQPRKLKAAKASKTPKASKAPKASKSAKGAPEPDDDAPNDDAPIDDDAPNDDGYYGGPGNDDGYYGGPGRCLSGTCPFRPNIKCYGFEDPTRRRLEITLTPLTVNINTDYNGADTSFAIRDTKAFLGDPSGIIAGCPQGYFANDSQSSFTVMVDPSDCFEVIVWDCYGDGMCNNGLAMVGEINNMCPGKWSAELDGNNVTSPSDGIFYEQSIYIGNCEPLMP